MFEKKSNGDFANPLSYDGTLLPVAPDIVRFDRFLSFGMYHAWNFITAKRKSLFYNFLYTDNDICLLRQQFLICLQNATQAFYKCPGGEKPISYFSDNYEPLLIPNPLEYKSREEFDADELENRSGRTLRWHYLGYFKGHKTKKKRKYPVHYLEFAFVVDNLSEEPDARTGHTRIFRISILSLPVAREMVNKFRSLNKFCRHMPSLVAN